MIRKIVIFDGASETNLDVTNNADVGFSFYDKLAESLDEGQINLQFMDREEEFTMFDSITFLIGNELHTYLISSDNVEIATKNPIKYSHQLTFVEPTKVLEKENTYGFKTVQPTVEGATLLTLYDEILRLRNTHPLEVASNVNSTRLFNIPQATRDVLESVIAPELTLPPMTLREAIDSYLGTIDGIARLDGSRNLTIDFLNETLEVIGDIDSNFAEKRRNKTIEFNTSGLSSEMLNVINDNEFSQSVEIYPAKGAYTTIRADDYYLDFLKSYIPTPKKIYYINRLYALVFIDITFNANLGSGDSLTVNDIPFLLNLAEKGNTFINNRVYERSEFNTLPYDDALEDVKQINSLWYEQGKNNIRVGDTSGIFDITTNLDNAITDTFNEITSLVVNGQVDEYQPLLDMLLEQGFGDWIRDDGSILDPKYLGEFASEPPNQEGYYYFNTTTSEYFVSLSGTWTFVSSYDPIPNKSFVRDTSVLNIQDTPFQVHYQPILDSLLVNIEKTYTNDVFYRLNMFSNQRAKIIDLNDFANNMKGRVDRLGGGELQITHIVNDLDKRYNVGDYTTNNEIIIERETIPYKQEAIVKYTLSKNFNRISQFFGVNSEIRQWDIPQNKRTTTRNYIYKDYCVVSAHNDINYVGEFTTEALTTLGKNTILETINDGSTYEQVRGGYIVTSEPKNVYISVGSNGTSGKNLVFDFKAEDNQIIGNRVVTETNIVDQDGLEGVRYTDSNGEIFNLDLSFVTALNEATTASDFLKFSNLFPELPASRINTSLRPIIFDSLNVQKSSGEILEATYQVDFFPNNTDVYIGDTFFKRNRLVNENNFISNQLKIVRYTNKTIRNIKLKQLPTLDVGDSEVAIGNVTVDSIPISGNINIDTTKNHYNVVVQLDGYTMWALADGDDNILFAVNQDPLNPYYIIQFDFTHFRKGIKDFYYDENVFRIVDFNTNGGLPVPETQIYIEDTIIQEPQTPTREDYVFLGWDVSFPYTVTTSVTINALWQPSFGGGNIDMLFNITPSGIKKDKFIEGSSIGLIGNITPNGYILQTGDGGTIGLTANITPEGLSIGNQVGSTSIDLSVTISPQGQVSQYNGFGNIDLIANITPSGIAKQTLLGSTDIDLSMNISPSGIDTPFDRFSGSTSIALSSDLGIIGTGYKWVSTDTYFSPTDVGFNENLEPNEASSKTVCTYNVQLDTWACEDFTSTSGTISS